MMMNTLIKNIQYIVSTISIKFENEAKRNETIETIMEADEYVAAKTKVDTFSDYGVYPLEVLYNAPHLVAYTENNEERLFNYASNPSTIPKEYRQEVLKAQREYIVTNYIETNNYYRKYAGLPNLNDDEEDFISLTQQQRLITGIVDIGYVHELSTTDIYKLQEYGILDELIRENPTKEYLKFLGANKVEIHTARLTKNFDIMKINKGDLSDEFFSSFIRIYEQNREYFSTTIYNRDFANNYDLYDRFIGLAIMVMTIQRLISNVFKFGINREFYDWDFIRNLYGTYNIPFIENLPIEYQMLLVKNMNNLLRYKSTDKVLFDICSLLGYDRLKIFKYYLVKRHRLDENEKPIFYYKQTVDENHRPVYDNNGDPIYELDFEKTYDLYFQGVDLRETNLLLALQDTSKAIPYKEMISTDPYWWEDQDLTKLKYQNTYNYIETKYLSMNIAYKMTEMLFEVTYFLREIITNHKTTKNISIDLPRVYPGVDFDIFHVIIFLVAAMCKIHGFSNYTITKPSMISHVLGFNFDPESVAAIKKIITDNPDKVDPETLMYFEHLDITTAEDVNRVYKKIYEFNKFVIDKMRYSTDLEEYRLYKQIFKIAMVSKLSDEMFTVTEYDDQGVPTEKVATSYLEYLEYNQPIFADIIKTTEPDKLSSYVNSTITRLESFVKSLKYLFIINNSTDDPVYISLIKLLQFFKSYTVDLNNFNIVYIFDSGFYNLIKILDDFNLTKEFELKDLDTEQYYHDIVKAISMAVKLEGHDVNVDEKIWYTVTHFPIEKVLMEHDITDIIINYWFKEDFKHYYRDIFDVVKVRHYHEDIEDIKEAFNIIISHVYQDTMDMRDKDPEIFNEYFVDEYFNKTYREKVQDFIKIMQLDDGYTIEEKIHRLIEISYNEICELINSIHISKDLSFKEEILGLYSDLVNEYKTNIYNTDDIILLEQLVGMIVTATYNLKIKLRNALGPVSKELRFIDDLNYQFNDLPVQHNMFKYHDKTAILNDQLKITISD